MIAADDNFAPPTAVVAVIRHGFYETDYHLDRMAEEVGSKLFPDTWAKIVQEVGKRKALDFAGAYVLRAIEHVANGLEKQAELAEFDAAQRRVCATALREKLDRTEDVAERLEKQAELAELDAAQRRVCAAELREKLDRREHGLL